MLSAIAAPEPSTGQRGGLFRGESMTEALTVYLPATAGFRVVGLVRGFLLAWLLATPEYGLLTAALLVINVLTPVCGLGLNEAIARYAPHFEACGSLRSFLRRMIPLVVVVALAASAAMLILAEPLGTVLIRSVRGDETWPGGGPVTSIMRWVVVTVFGLAAYYVVLGVLRGLRMFRAVSLMELSQALLFTGGSVAAAYLFSPTARTVVIMYALGVLATFAVFAASLAQRINRWAEQRRPVPEGEAVIWRVFRFAVWAAAAGVMWQVLQHYPGMWLNKVHGKDALAVFGAMRYVAQVAMLAGTPVIAVATTMITRTWETEGRAAADRRFQLLFKATGLGLLGISVGVALSRAGIVRLLPPAFAPGGVVIPLFLLFYLLGAHLTFLQIHFALIERTRLLFLPWILGVIANVGLNLLWVRPGVPGTAVPSAAQQLLPTAWASVAAMAFALASLVGLLILQRRPVDRGTWIVMAASFGLCLPWAGMVAVALACVAVARPLIFTESEIRVLGEEGRRLAAVARHLVRRAGRREPR